MNLTQLQLLPTVTHGTPSGNYDGSSVDFVGVPQKAAAYYRRREGLQTVVFLFDQFQGQLTLQATLDSHPDTENWFDLETINAAQQPTSQQFSKNYQGNFVWIRASVSAFTDGSIDKVTVSY